MAGPLILVRKRGSDVQFTAVLSPATDVTAHLRNEGTSRLLQISGTAFSDNVTIKFHSRLDTPVRAEPLTRLPHRRRCRMSVSRFGQRCIADCSQTRNAAAYQERKLKRMGAVDEGARNDGCSGGDQKSCKVLQGARRGHVAGGADCLCVAPNRRYPQSE